MSQDVNNRSFLKSHALYKTVDNRKVLEDQRAMIAKCLDESLAARNKLYEANQQRMKNQGCRKKILSFNNKCRLPKLVSTRSFFLDFAWSIIITKKPFHQVL